MSERNEMQLGSTRRKLSTSNRMWHSLRHAGTRNMMSDVERYRLKTFLL